MSRTTISKALAMGGVALALGTAVAFPAGASAAVTAPVSIDFSADSAGARPNGFTSADSGKVFFYDTSGANLEVADYGNQGHGNALAVLADDASALEMRLSAPANAIKLTFGNDQPGVVNGSDIARLTLYRGSALVGQVDVNVNANDVADQTIAKAPGALFNRATFQYVDAAGNPKNLIEIVDDIQLGPLCTVTGTTAGDVLTGTSGSDVICGDAGSDTINAGGGNDLVLAGSGRDTVYGGSGRDVVVGGKGRDHLYGGRAADRLQGQSGRDYLDGGKGSDRCEGGTGHDASHLCESKAGIP